MAVTTGDIGGYIDLLKGLKAGVDENTIPVINWKEIRPFLAMEHFTVEIIQSKNSAAAGVCSFVVNIVMVRTVCVRSTFVFLANAVIAWRWTLCVPINSGCTGSSLYFH